jgi:hypothetical protein
MSRNKSRHNGVVSYHRPALFAGHEFSAFQGGDDPAAMSALAHETASRVLANVQGAPPEVINRAITVADEHGLDVVAELWSHSDPHTLPGSLWQIYLIRAVTRQRASEIGHLYSLGMDSLSTADPIVAGVPEGAGANDMRDLADAVLHGAFTGDYGDALDRAAAFCRVIAAGSLVEAHAAESLAPKRAQECTTQAARLSSMATALTRCAHLWRRGDLG